MSERPLQILEDPRSPLLGPSVKGLRFLGILLPDNLRERYFKLFFNFLLFVFIVTEYIDLYLIRHDLIQFLLSLQLITCTTISGIKVITFFIWQKRWLSLIAYVTEGDLEQRKSTDPLNVELVRKFTRYSRKLSYMLLGAMIGTGLNTLLRPVWKFIITPTYRYDVLSGSIDPFEMVRSWAPWSKRTLTGYIAVSLYQIYAAVLAVSWIVSMDSCAMVILVFLRVELEVLRNDCRNIFGSEDSPVDEVEFRRRIKNYHKRHIDLLKYARMYNSCMSPVMLLYMFVCPIMLCSITYQLSDATNVIEYFLLINQLLVGLMQLFLFCWHSNEVTFASKDLMLGPYESRWYCGSVSQQRDICILIHQFQASIIFTAGPFTELTAATFINIVKVAYSYVTLLKQTKSQ